VSRYFFRTGERSRWIWLPGVVLVSLFFCAFALTQESSGEQKETFPQSVAPQPIAFSHKTHAGESAMPCNFCHTGVDREDEAKIPSADFCMSCHQVIRKDSPEVAKIRDAAEKKKKIAWVPVYTVPDFVFFGHSTHIKAGLKCVECHGPVETRAVLQKEISTSMNSCRSCHQSRGARTDCATCHQLGH
jgi:hypothetical protein